MYYDNLVNEQYMTKKLSRIIYQTFCALNKIYHFTTLAFELFWPYHNWISTRGYELKDLSDGSQSFCYIHCLWLESPFIILTRILSYPESSAAVHIAIFTTPATPICLRADRADSCIPPNFLEPLSKQASKPISTFKLIFWLLGHLLLKAKNPQVRQVQHLLHQEKRSSEPTAYLVNWLWTLQVLPCISQLICNPEKNFPPMNLTQLCKLTVVTTFLWAIVPQKSSIIRWLSAKKIEERKGPRGTLIYTAATKLLNTGFGTAEHFVQRSKDSEDFNAGNTSYTYIQEFFCSNLTNMNSLENHVISYIFKDTRMIRELHNTLLVVSWAKWGPSKPYLLKNLTKISLSIEHDWQSSNWTYASVFNPMTNKLCDHVIPTYNAIWFCQWGRITLTNLVLGETFFMHHNIINTLKNFLKIFESKGLTFI